MDINNMLVYTYVYMHISMHRYYTHMLYVLYVSYMQNIPYYLQFWHILPIGFQKEEREREKKGRMKTFNLFVPPTTRKCR